MEGWMDRCGSMRNGRLDGSMLWIEIFGIKKVKF